MWKCSREDGDIEFTVDIDTRKFGSDNSGGNESMMNMKDRNIWMVSGDDASRCDCHCDIESPSIPYSMIATNIYPTQPSFYPTDDIYVAKAFIAPSHFPSQIPSFSPSLLLAVNPTDFPSAVPT